MTAPSLTPGGDLAIQMTSAKTDSDDLQHSAPRTRVTPLRLIPSKQFRRDIVYVSACILATAVAAAGVACTRSYGSPLGSKPQLLTLTQVQSVFSSVGLVLSIEGARHYRTIPPDSFVGLKKLSRRFTVQIWLFPTERQAIILYRQLLPSSRRMDWPERRIANMVLQVQPPGLLSARVEMPARVALGLARLARELHR